METNEPENCDYLDWMRKKGETTAAALRDWAERENRKVTLEKAQLA
jgi:hypothetical protein